MEDKNKIEINEEELGNASGGAHPLHRKICPYCNQTYSVLTKVHLLRCEAYKKLKNQ